MRENNCSMYSNNKFVCRPRWQWTRTADALHSHTTVGVCIQRSVDACVGLRARLRASGLGCLMKCCVTWTFAAVGRQKIPGKYDFREILGQYSFSKQHILQNIYIFITFALKMRKVMFWSPCIYLFICMGVTRITQKVLNQIAWNLVGWLVIIRGPFG